MENLFTTIPPPVAHKKDGQLTQQQLEQFFTDGFVILPDYITHEKLEACRGAMDAMVDTLADKLYKAGKISDRCEGYGFRDRLIHLDKAFPGAAVLIHKATRCPDAFKAIWCDERLLNVVEQLIGPNIAGHPVWNLRSKIPQNEQLTVPWHQDAAYLSPEADRTLTVTAWVPLVDANLTNGCLQMVRGGHRREKVAEHVCCAGNTWYVDLPEDEMQRTLGVDLSRDVVTCEFGVGGVLLFNNLIPHRSLQNRSDGIRWSLDLRWFNPTQPTGFWGLVPPVMMRDASRPGLSIDWSSTETDRHTTQGGGKGETEVAGGDGDDSEFDTTNGGPWMERWRVTHENRHTRAYLDRKASKGRWTGGQ